MNPGSPANLDTAEVGILSTEQASRNLLSDAAQLVESGMQAVNQCIKGNLNSDIALINSLSAYIINSGGKRLRPLTLLLCSRTLGLDDTNQNAVLLAAVIEFIHTATLLHDDVVDNSDLRRGNATANAVWGNEASVLVGDFLYSRAFEMMVKTNKMAVMDVMAHTTNRIAEGEVMQLLNAHSADLTENQYLETITRKTAKLFESAGQLAAVISDADESVYLGLAAYGRHLGTAFQIVDDMLDYTQDAASMGKDPGDDLAEGKPTLPVIQAMKTASKADQEIIRNAIENGDRESITRITQIIESTGALAYTSRRAVAEANLAKQALKCLPDSRYRQALENLAEFSVARTF
ncbi:MAG: octaprenyl diphosphate synthase [marine bacterium B5-7]|nr:MAG: octaprenyl diphosphate synthase [marine bacterium B5-7]